MTTQSTQGNVELRKPSAGEIGAVDSNEVSNKSTVPGTSLTDALEALKATGLLLTTKGDLLTHNGTIAVRMPVGTVNGHILTVDNTAPLGIKWAAGGGGGGGDLMSDGSVPMSDLFDLNENGLKWNATYSEVFTPGAFPFDYSSRNLPIMVDGGAGYPKVGMVSIVGGTPPAPNIAGIVVVDPGFPAIDNNFFSLIGFAPFGGGPGGVMGQFGNAGLNMDITYRDFDGNGFFSIDTEKPGGVLRADVSLRQECYFNFSGVAKIRADVTDNLTFSDNFNVGVTLSSLVNPTGTTSDTFTIDSDGTAVSGGKLYGSSATGKILYLINNKVEETAGNPAYLELSNTSLALRKMVSSAITDGLAIDMGGADHSCSIALNSNTIFSLSKLGVIAFGPDIPGNFFMLDPAGVTGIRTLSFLNYSGTVCTYTGTPTANQVPQWNDLLGQWIPATVGGGGSGDFMADGSVAMTGHLRFDETATIKSIAWAGPGPDDDGFLTHEALSGGDKTWTFPNTTGTIALTTVFKNVFNVASNGSASGTGSESAPFATIAQAVAAVPGGEAALINVGVGTFAVTALVLPNNVSLQGQGIAETIIDGDMTTGAAGGFSLKGFQIASDNYLIIQGSCSVYDVYSYANVKISGAATVQAFNFTIKPAVGVALAMISSGLFQSFISTIQAVGGNVAILQNAGAGTILLNTCEVLNSDAVNPAILSTSGNVILISSRVINTGGGRAAELLNNAGAGAPNALLGNIFVGTATPVICALAVTLIEVNNGAISGSALITHNHDSEYLKLIGGSLTGDLALDDTGSIKNYKWTGAGAGDDGYLAHLALSGGDKTWLLPNKSGTVAMLSDVTGGAFDAIVETGGTYPLLSDAVTAGAKSIYVKDGTYNEIANITLAADTIIVGESWNAVINMSTKRILCSAGCRISNIKLTGVIESTSLLYMDDDCTAEDVYFKSACVLVPGVQRALCYVQTGKRNANINRCVFEFVTASSNEAGVEYLASNGSILNCIFIGISNPAGNVCIDASSAGAGVTINNIQGIQTFNLIRAIEGPTVQYAEAANISDIACTWSSGVIRGSYLPSLRCNYCIVENVRVYGLTSLFGATGDAKTKFIACGLVGGFDAASGGNYSSIIFDSCIFFGSYLDHADGMGFMFCNCLIQSVSDITMLGSGYQISNCKFDYENLILSKGNHRISNSKFAKSILCGAASDYNSFTGNSCGVAGGGTTNTIDFPSGSDYNIAIGNHLDSALTDAGTGNVADHNIVF